MNTATKASIARTEVTAPPCILQSVLAAINNGKISEAVDQFDDDFKFQRPKLSDSSYRQRTFA